MPAGNAIFLLIPWELKWYTGRLLADEVHAWKEMTISERIWKFGIQ